MTSTDPNILAAYWIGTDYLRAAERGAYRNRPQPSRYTTWMALHAAHCLIHVDALMN